MRNSERVGHLCYTNIKMLFNMPFYMKKVFNLVSQIYLYGVNRKHGKKLIQGKTKVIHGHKSQSEALRLKQEKLYVDD